MIIDKDDHILLRNKRTGRFQYGISDIWENDVGTKLRNKWVFIKVIPGKDHDKSKRYVEKLNEEKGPPEPKPRPAVNSRWIHYKDVNRETPYRVLYMAKDTETLEDLVIYKRDAPGGQIWARPLSMWYETVIGVKYPGPRFVEYE